MLLGQPEKNTHGNVRPPSLDQGSQSYRTGQTGRRLWKKHRMHQNRGREKSEGKTRTCMPPGRQSWRLRVAKADDGCSPGSYGKVSSGVSRSASTLARHLLCSRPHCCAMLSTSGRASLSKMAFIERRAALIGIRRISQPSVSGRVDLSGRPRKEPLLVERLSKCFRFPFDATGPAGPRARLRELRDCVFEPDLSVLSATGDGQRCPRRIVSTSIGPSRTVSTALLSS
ncbi:hypothetical protein Rpal_2285 [Rhodopseudomonas palustris TIE-1]|nr:hypothetical protein Rpal_2285 [Rhodopseudomonas palustris TIE-1]